MTFVPENDLEATLMRAASDPSARPEFLRLLLESELLVLGCIDRSIPNGVSQVAQPGDKLLVEGIQHKGKPYLPIFSSLTRLRAFIRDQRQYVQANGRGIFEAMKGASFLLNPGSDYGKELLPAEIERCLDPSCNPPQVITFEQPTKVLIGQPTNYPHDLAKALCQLFTIRPEVIAAYLAQIAFEDGSVPAHPLIGIETEGEWQPIANEMANVAHIVVPGMLVDTVKIDRTKPEDIWARNLLKVSPFYSRIQTKP